MKRSTSILALALALVLAATGCTSDGAADDEASGGGSGGGTGGGSGGSPDCFESPTTHFEIINACTDSVRVERNPDLRLLAPDGGLPPP